MADRLTPYGINTGVVPPGGWHYKQPWGEPGETHDIGGPGYTPDILVMEVTRFRIEQNIPMGDPAHDVAEYIRSIAPGNNLRHRSAYDPATTKARPIRPLAERVREWLTIKRMKPVRLHVTTDDPRKCGLRCANCTHNIRNWHSSCVPCNEKIEHEGMNLRQRTSFELDKKLGCCRLYGMFLPAAIFLDMDDHPDRLPNSPSICWVKKPL